MGISRADTFIATCDKCGVQKQFTVANNPALAVHMYGRVPEGWDYRGRDIPGDPQYNIEPRRVTDLLCPTCLNKR